MTTTVRLIDGRQVDSSGPDWRAECRTRHKHVQALLALRGPGGRHLRQSYLYTVEVAEGEEARQRLQVAFSAAWDSARGQGAGG